MKRPVAERWDFPAADLDPLLVGLCKPWSYRRIPGTRLGAVEVSDDRVTQDQGVRRVVDGSQPLRQMLWAASAVWPRATGIGDARPLTGVGGISEMRPGAKGRSCVHRKTVWTILR